MPYSEKTRRVYCSVVHSLASFMRTEGLQSLEEFNVAWLRRFLTRGGSSDRSPYSASYQVVRLAALGAFWCWLADALDITDNPVTQHIQERRNLRSRPGRPSGGKRARRLPQVLHWREQRALLSAVQRSHSRAAIRDYAMLSLILATGLRSDEVCRVEVQAVDLAARRLRVVGKGNKERLVDFSHDDAVLGALEMWLAERARLLDAVGGEESCFFLSMTGRRMSGSLVYQQVSRYLRSLGLEERSRGNGAHLLRHTATSIMFARCVPLLQIQENLGHENLATTQIYAHLLPTEAASMTE